jgi:hypothetical protein
MKTMYFLKLFDAIKNVSNIKKIIKTNNYNPFLKTNKYLDSYLDSYLEWSNNRVHTFDILKQTEHYRILTHYIDSSQNNKLKNIIKSNNYLYDHLIGYYQTNQIHIIQGYHFLEQLFVDIRHNQISNIKIIYSDSNLIKISFIKTIDGIIYRKFNGSFLLNIDYSGYICLGLFSHLNSLNMTKTKYGQIICPSFDSNDKIKTFYLK